MAAAAFASAEQFQGEIALDRFAFAACIVEKGRNRQVPAFSVEQSTLEMLCGGGTLLQKGPSPHPLPRKPSTLRAALHAAFPNLPSMPQ
ncbi:hypothetical protein KL86DES1_21419 [uncultured Desulfovibrio sp.]|uniref:Uncharacterized protein n=1 Tax=uncultured Desulfovibrio sp. TaxID=167968 RepID=A0A212L7U5_9BACT|nr:hypothetical protein KL86DES1_21419 [uncultured Desulfovibrio sp.]VZH34316.1 conserved protein of unknown function [Desulfovibrio sp. 86]